VLSVVACATCPDARQLQPAPIDFDGFSTQAQSPLMLGDRRGHSLRHREEAIPPLPIAVFPIFLIASPGKLGGLCSAVR